MVVCVFRRGTMVVCVFVYLEVVIMMVHRFYLTAIGITEKSCR